MVTGTSNSPKQPIDTYTRLAHLLHTTPPDREALLDRVYEELLARESRAYASRLVGRPDGGGALPASPSRPVLKTAGTVAPPASTVPA